jgi:hypothetical protein
VENCFLIGAKNTLKIGSGKSNFHGKIQLMIERAKQRKTIQRHLKRSPVVAILGARQVEKPRWRERS